jgi:selenocysteine lyase/cysteine desulfurase
MQDLGVDVLAAAGHKGLYGPMGTGVLVLSAPSPVKPFREGGTGFKSESPEQPEEYPWRLEAGTLSLPGIAGLAAGVRFVRSVGVNAIAEHEAMLARGLADGLRQIEGVSVFCDPAPRTGVVSFRLDAGDVALTGTILDESFGIAVRTGLHCFPAAHRPSRRDRARQLRSIQHPQRRGRAPRRRPSNREDARSRSIRSSVGSTSLSVSVTDRCNLHSRSIGEMGARSP